MTTATVPFYQKLSFNLFSIGVLIVALYFGQSILLPVFFAILLAILLLPIVQFLQKHKFNRLFSIAVTLLFSLVIIAAVIYFLSTQAANFFDDLPTIKQRLSDVVSSLKEWVHSTFNIAVRKQEQYIKETTKSMETSSPGGIVAMTFMSLTGLLAYVVIMPIYTFLILYYRDLIRRFLIGTFKNTDEAQVTEILHESQIVSQSYIRGLVIEMVIVFALNSAGFLILGIKYAIFLGLVAAMLNLIPYIGMLVANVFCMLITLTSSENLSDVLWVGVILAAVQFIDNNFLMPLIVGSRVKINALAAIVGVFVGGALCGVAGMFLSIPGLAILKVIFDRVKDLKPYGMLLGDDSDESATKLKHAKK